MEDEKAPFTVVKIIENECHYVEGHTFYTMDPTYDFSHPCMTAERLAEVMLSYIRKGPVIFSVEKANPTKE